MIGYEAVMKAYNGMPADYHVAETGCRLVFERQQSQVRILSTLNRYTDAVDATELLNVFETFVRMIKNLVIEEAPEISVHGFWRTWLGAHPQGKLPLSCSSKLRRQDPAGAAAAECHSYSLV
jgi:hypothetical protein